MKEKAVIHIDEGRPTADIYSRNDLSEEQFAVVAGKASRSAGSFDESADEILESDNSREFLNKWVNGYGHDSLRELATIGVFFEGVSQQIVKIIEGKPRGAYSEQSTRYQTMDAKRVYNPYTVYRELGGTAAVAKEAAFDRTVEELFSLYHDILRRGEEHLQGQGLPKREIHGRVHDAARYCLPLGTMANLAAKMDARAWCRVLRELRATNLSEAQDVADMLEDVLKRSCPTLIAHTEASDFYEMVHSYLEGVVDKRDPTEPEGLDRYSMGVTIVTDEAWISQERIDLLIKYIAMRHTGYVYEDKRDLDMRKVLSFRDKHDPIPDEFFMIPVRADFNTDIGTWRDLQRHRPCNQWRTEFCPWYDDFSVPPLVEETGLGDRFREVMNKCVNAYYKDLEGNTLEANYVVPFAFHVCYSWLTTLGQMMYVCELRSQPGGHESYRVLAKSAAKQLMEAFPFLNGCWAPEKPNPLVCWG